MKNQSGTMVQKYSRILMKILKKLLPPILIDGINQAFYLLQRTHQEDLPGEFNKLPRAEQALHSLIHNYDFETVLDIGSGAGEHAKLLAKNGKKVTTIDFGTSYYALKQNDIPGTIKCVKGDFYSMNTNKRFDAVWASHVLEHQPNPGLFIQKCIELTKPNGLICITVPPLKHNIVGGHLTLWNAGLLLYNLVFNGLDCRSASILTSGSNITVIVNNIKRNEVALDWDRGDIDRVLEFFPTFAKEPFDGRITEWNWK